MGFLGFANVYAMRVNLSVAIVAMVNTTVSNTTDVITDVCPDYQVNTTEPTVSTETILPDLCTKVCVNQLLCLFIAKW